MFIVLEPINKTSIVELVRTKTFEEAEKEVILHSNTRGKHTDMLIIEKNDTGKQVASWYYNKGKMKFESRTAGK